MKELKYWGKMMKMMLCVSIAFTFYLSPFSLHAQKYACINTDYVLRSIPDYTNAVKRLDKYVDDWTKELNEKNDAVAAMRADFEQESYLLPENLKKRRQEEIKAAEEEIKTLQQQRFGPGGDLEKKRTELLKPVQDRVFAVVERLVQEKNYAMVFDKAGSPAVLFVNKKYDISDEVLELLGYKPGSSASPIPDDPGSKGSKDSKESKSRMEKRIDNPEFRNPSNSGSSKSSRQPMRENSVRKN